jgi:ADP-ribosylglycohydrolase
LKIPDDYAERVYAGVLGKIIGVYLGRPFEGWDHRRIECELGEVDYYVNDRRDLPLKNHTLVVTDDDISGTFTFLRALPDYGSGLDLSPAQIGQTWLNYIIERRTILWWGGMGNSTEHTAYLRLKNGIRAPESGSIALNGKVVAEQIGSQIFIDGWAMVAPGDPELAADLARSAASVSHDGEAVYGAQVVAAMEAGAFVEKDLERLIDTAVSFVPRDSVIYGMIDDVRGWHAGEKDWRKTRDLIEAHYGYDKFGGNCHMVPNHALIIHALLHGEDDFQRSLMIVNTCGWDTDCNSGNVGCLLGIKNGLPAIDAGHDWRGPVADRMYLPTADGGRAITDAYHLVNVGRSLAGREPAAPKDRARFHFELPGSVQGFQPDRDPASGGVATAENVVGHSETGSRSLAIRYGNLAPGRPARVSTPTFIPRKPWRCRTTAS